jgi:hypothetical protein
MLHGPVETFTGPYYVIGVYCNERIIFSARSIKITGAYQNNIAVKVYLIA